MKSGADAAKTGGNWGSARTRTIHLGTGLVGALLMTPNYHRPQPVEVLGSCISGIA